MNSIQIARAILERRKHSTIVMVGEMRELLGEDGFSQALARRWIITDNISGDLLVTHYEEKIVEMTALAEADQVYKIGDSVMIADNGKTYPAVVKGIRPDGSYILSFGDSKPQRELPQYAANEVQPIARPEIDPANPQKIKRFNPLDNKPASNSSPTTVSPGSTGVRGFGIGS